MATSKPNVVELVNQMPDSDQPGQESKFTGPEPEKAQKLFEELLAGGSESIVELIASIRAPGDPDFTSYRAEYLLHCLAVYVGGAGKEAQRKLLAETVAAQLGNAQLAKPVRGLLARELQVVGAKEAVTALGGLLLDEELCGYAATALAAIREGASEQLRRALPKATGACRLAILQNVGVLRDGESSSALKKALSDGDREARLAAAWALAQIAQPSSVDLLLRAAEAPSGYERIKATQACLVLAENLAAAGNKREAIRVYAHLRDTRSDRAEQYVRDLAAKALAAL
jgi:HEAT repeat protein